LVNKKFFSEKNVKDGCAYVSKRRKDSDLPCTLQRDVN